MFEPGRVSSYWFSGMNGILVFFSRRDPFGDIQRASFPETKFGIYWTQDETRDLFDDFRTFFLVEKSALISSRENS